MMTIATLQILCVLFIIYKLISETPTYMTGKPKVTKSLKNYPKVSIIVPARNEEDNISRSINSLANQDYPKEKLEIIVVDDNSTDKTSEIVGNIISNNSNVSIVNLKDLPKDWSGKSHACWQGAKKASGEYIFFIDADTKSEPSMVTSSINFMQENKLEYMSLLPKQLFKSFFEKMVLPFNFILIFLGFSLKKTNENKSKHILSNGQCIIIKKDVYEQVGGHKAVANAVLDDVEFAKVVIKNGYKIFLANGEDLISVRMYTGFKSVWDGFSKNSSGIFGGLKRAVLFSFLGLLVSWTSIILPIFTIHNGFNNYSFYSFEFIIFVISIIQFFIIFIIHFSLLVKLDVGVQYSLFYPIGYTVVSLIILNSIRLKRIKKRTWKGRTY